jgi:hypothetical protein
MPRRFLGVRSLTLGSALSAAFVLGGCVGDLAMPHRATVTETRPLAANGRLDLQNTNGRVEVDAWDEAQVRIEAVKHAASEHALGEIEIEIAAEGDRVSVRTRHPRPRWLGGAGRVDYSVRVPRGARVAVQNVNGRVEIEGVEAALEAATVNGSVEVTGAAAEVEASAVNGSVSVAMARVDPSGRSRLSTTNGSVRLTLPRDASADVEARTVNGGVGCDFDLADAHRSRRRLEGRIAGGGARFELATRERRRPRRPGAAGGRLAGVGGGAAFRRLALAGTRGPAIRRTAGPGRRVTERPPSPSRRLVRDRGFHHDRG